MKKLLIVEDDQLVANIYGRKLANEGFRVQVASDGPKGLEILRSFHPDLVIVDLMLPTMSGVELIRQIRAEPGIGQVPLLILSNTYLTSMVQDAWRAGATRCLSKASCTPNQVLQVINTLLGIASPAPTPKPDRASAAGEPPAAERTPPASEPSEPLAAGFRSSLADTLRILRVELQSVIKTHDENQRVRQVFAMYCRVHTAAGSAAATDQGDLAQMTLALEAFLKELHEKPIAINSSTLRTVAAAIDFLGFMLKRSPEAGASPTLSPSKILVVDDDELSRRAVTYALERAKLDSVGLADSTLAFKLLSETSFDLVLLDVDMPGMSGYELCRKMRELPAHKKTPVIFVTCLNSFEARAASTMSGGNDLIAKPFLFIELAVKALIHMLRGRMEASLNAAAVKAA